MEGAASAKRKDPEDTSPAAIAMRKLSAGLSPCLDFFAVRVSAPVCSAPPGGRCSHGACTLLGGPL